MAARVAWGSIECHWGYSELKVSSDKSSGRSLDTASKNTGPIGTGGGCSSEDADQTNVSCICAKIKVEKESSPDVQFWMV